MGRLFPMRPLRECGACIVTGKVLLPGDLLLAVCGFQHDLPFMVHINTLIQHVHNSHWGSIDP